ERPRRCYRVPAERGDRVRLDGLDHVLPADHRADREPVAKALGAHDRIGPNAVRLDAPEGLAGAAEPRLDLVGHERDAELVEDALHDLEVLLRRRDEA